MSRKWSSPDFSNPEKKSFTFGNLHSSKCFEWWNKSQWLENVINDSKIVKIVQQSAEAVNYQAVNYHVQQTGLSMADILTTGNTKRYAVDIQKTNVLVDFTRKHLFLVDMSSNSWPPL